MFDALPHAYAIAQQQHGAISHAQARDVGMSEDQVFRAQAARIFVPEHKGVYLVGGTPALWRPKLVCATLAGGALVAVSHRAAAKLHALPGFDQELVEITVPYEQQYGAGNVISHRSRNLPPVDVTVVDAIRVTTVSRTLIDLASMTTFETLQEATDEAIRRGDTSASRLRWRLSELGGPGRKGTSMLREILDEYRPGEKVPASVFERRLLRIVSDARLPRPTIRPLIPVGGGRSIEVDAAWLEYNVCVEANSSRHHDTQQRIENDEVRRALLAAAGYRVVPVRWTAMQRRANQVGSWFRDALLAGGWVP